MIEYLKIADQRRISPQNGQWIQVMQKMQAAYLSRHLKNVIAQPFVTFFSTPLKGTPVPWTFHPSSHLKRDQIVKLPLFAKEFTTQKAVKTELTSMRKMVGRYRTWRKAAELKGNRGEDWRGKEKLHEFRRLRRTNQITIELRRRNIAESLGEDARRHWNSSR